MRTGTLDTHHTHQYSIHGSGSLARDLPHRLVAQLPPGQTCHLANEEDKSSSNYNNKPMNGLINQTSVQLYI